MSQTQETTECTIISNRRVKLTDKLNALRNQKLQTEEVQTAQKG